ncbi:MAG: hypothetical protein NZM11_11730 [Anaerolineales bacterium]|nr:hypothetical protein [Anaerolineales bacterium]
MSRPVMRRAMRSWASAQVANHKTFWKPCAQHATSPLKLFEYFALEKPVVVTSDMIECIAYQAVFHASSVEGFSNAIDQASKLRDDENYKAQLRKLADENDWIERAKAFEKVFQSQ